MSADIDDVFGYNGSQDTKKCFRFISCKPKLKEKDTDLIFMKARCQDKDTASSNNSQPVHTVPLSK